MPTSEHRASVGLEVMSPGNRMKSIEPALTLRGWAFLVLAVLMFLLLVPLSRPAEGGVFGENLRNLLHVPLFAIVTLLLRFLQVSVPPRWRLLLVCAIAASLLAVVSEVAQSFTGRTPSVEDLGADLSGILLTCTVLLRGSSRRVLIVRLMLLLAGGGMFALAVRPLVEEVNIARASRDAFPRLVNLECPHGLWQAQGATRLQMVKRTEGNGLDVQMASGSYEGLRYAVPKGVDAVGYSSLLIETDNPGDAFELGVRMDSDVRKRRYGSVLVPRGQAVMRVKWSSCRGDGKLVRVVLFTGEDQPARRFQLLGARLVREISTVPVGR